MVIIQGRKTHNYKGRGKRCKETHDVPRGALSSGPASMICHCLQFRFSNGGQKERKREKINSQILANVLSFRRTYITVKCKS
ncbi:hypothetical protein VIGAN_03050500, partial [Vigna angularis var. angularis]